MYAYVVIATIFGEQRYIAYIVSEKNRTLCLS